MMIAKFVWWQTECFKFFGKKSIFFINKIRFTFITLQKLNCLKMSTSTLWTQRKNSILVEKTLNHRQKFLPYTWSFSFYKFRSLDLNKNPLLMSTLFKTAYLCFSFPNWKKILFINLIPKQSFYRKYFSVFSDEIELFTYFPHQILLFSNI
jgi:hypothetical protein